MKVHHFKSDADWFADLTQTAESVKKQNTALRKSDPCELTPDEVLELVRRAQGKKGDDHG